MYTARFVNIIFVAQNVIGVLLILNLVGLVHVMYSKYITQLKAFVSAADQVMKHLLAFYWKWIGAQNINFTQKMSPTSL